jgi:hypothetical protein
MALHYNRIRLLSSKNKNKNKTKQNKNKTKQKQKKQNSVVRCLVFGDARRVYMLPKKREMSVHVHSTRG